MAVHKIVLKHQFSAKIINIYFYKVFYNKTSKQTTSYLVDCIVNHFYSLFIINMYHKYIINNNIN